jgi:hypothetical protein
MCSQINEKLIELTTKRREMVDSSGIPTHKTFKAVFFKDEEIGDVPIPIIYKYIYDPKTLIQDDSRNFNFIYSCLLERRDYDIRFENINENKDSLPKYFTDPLFSKEIFKNFNEEKLKVLIEDFKEYPLSTDYHYYFIHPLKPVFMGPDKVNVHDHYKIHFISPTCLIVEIYSYCSGFMLMDTFYNVIQYKFDAELVSNDSKQITFKTRTTISWDVQFVKSNFFKGKVESEGMKDNETGTKEFWFVKIKELVLKESKNYYFGKPEPVEEVIERKKEEISKLEEEKEKIVRDIIEHKEIKVENRVFQNLITNYGVYLIVVFLVLLLSKFEFFSALVITVLLAFGAILKKLESISERLENLESRLNGKNKIN